MKEGGGREEEKEGERRRKETKYLSLSLSPSRGSSVKRERQEGEGKGKVFFSLEEIPLDVFEAVDDDIDDDDNRFVQSLTLRRHRQRIAGTHFSLCLKPQ